MAERRPCRHRRDVFLMRVKRPFLYVGIFLVAIGGVLVLADAGAIDTAILTDVVRLWPLAPIAVGAGLVLRRTNLSLAGGMVAAAVPGLLIGSGFAVVPRFAGNCGAQGEPAITASERGSFAGPPTVSVITGCGTFNVGTAPGGAWSLDAGNSLGRMPSIDATGQSLEIRSTAGHGWQALGSGRDRWELVLPEGAIDDLSIAANASRSHIGLAGARIGTFGLTANASDVVLDLTGASIADLSAVLNTGVLSIRLPAEADLAGSVRVGGGELQVCAPPGVALRVSWRGYAREVTAGGVLLEESEWRGPDDASAAYHANLDVRVNFGTIHINPIGGCR
jgi:hypothetical protein